ncbi:toxin-antitoxin system YwqK family antitoxin [Chitinophaga vietnamensis]|uniref:hypothetical protein n=1 Tax=Chitinophaga vietnamensis TaxID=2593957 RepID=UPI0011783C28|nr:hypothetical protein [Chitinophaga vietnamensis]
MRKTFLVFIFLIHGVAACHAQGPQASQPSLVKTTTMQSQEPLINDTFETLDLKTLQEKGRKTQAAVARPDGKMVSGTSYSLDETNDKGVRIVIFGDDVAGYVRREMLPDSYFEISKEFYPDGKIKAKGLRFVRGGFTKGTWYYFGTDGKLSKSINYDTPFRYTLEDVFRFLTNERIPIEKGPEKPNEGMKTSIFRTSDTLGPLWKILWLKDRNSMPNIVEEITIDGVSGKVLKRVDRKYNNS